ncbi:hypothetical protein H8D30_05770 [bacterium]|nr:hypothetical protein [bacterium]
MKRLAVIFLAGLALMSTGCKFKFVKGSISGTLFIVRNDQEYKGSYYGIQVVDEEGAVLGFTQTGTNGFFRFEVQGPTGEFIPLKMPWGDYTLNVFAPTMGNAGGGEEATPVYSEKVTLRKGALQVRVFMDWEDIKPANR